MCNFACTYPYTLHQRNSGCVPKTGFFQNLEEMVSTTGWHKTCLQKPLLHGLCRSLLSLPGSFYLSNLGFYHKIHSQWGQYELQLLPRSNFNVSTVSVPPSNTSSRISCERSATVGMWKPRSWSEYYFKAQVSVLKLRLSTSEGLRKERSIKPFAKSLCFTASYF